jgi:glycosyltransferase involved in cell wall biosynthesis
MKHETGVDAEQKPIRILHITFNMGFGGTEQVIRQLVTNLPTEKFDSRVLCIDGHVGAIGEQIAEEGFPVFALKRAQGFDWELARKIRSEIRDHKIDIVHCHQYTPWFYGWLAHIGTPAKVVFTEHGRFHPDRYRFKAMVINPLMALTTHAVIAISAATRDSLARYEFVPKQKIQVIYNGIRGLKRNEGIALKTRRELGIPDHAFVMGTVARLDPVKNQVIMLDAFAGILANAPDSWLLMVGDGPDRAMLEEKARSLGISDNVIFAGFQAYPENYLAAMDLFLLSSHTEGTSMTLLEAISMGIPAVATAVGGNPEIIDDGKTGYLTAPDDKDEFKDAVIRFRNQGEAFRKEVSEACKERFARRFSVATMTDNYTACYRSLI